jgi:outer membrane biosynthesis protein TonB
MRVRISFDALRLCLLVAAGATSGYLWRAAFEASSPPEQRLAAAPRIVHPAPSPPTVRISPHHLTAPAKRAVTNRVVRRAVVLNAPIPSTALVSQPVSSPSPQPSPASPLPPKPTPAPTPTPSQPPPTTTTTPPPAPTPTTPVAAPVQQTTSQTPTTTPTQTPTEPPTESPPGDDGSRPGWGNGDKNHDHTGPGGGKGK